MRGRQTTTRRCLAVGVPPRLLRSWGASSREQPPALFENPVGAAVELPRCLSHRQFAVDDMLGHDAYLIGNALPFGHFRHGLDALELLAKRSCINIIRERTFAPCAAARR